MSKLKTKVVKTAKPTSVESQKSKVKEAVRKLHLITDIARPQSGPRLYAHTFAALGVLGMLSKDRPAVRRSAVQSLLGGTAVRYHTSVKGNMVADGDRLRLTADGLTFFTGRKGDPDAVKGFDKLFRTGDGSAAGIKPTHIVPASVAI